MKRLFVFTVAVLIGAMGSAQAQKVNESALAGKIAKAEATSQDPKQNAKATTWLNLGEAYYAAGSAVSNAVFKGMTEGDVLYFIGKPAQTSQKSANGTDYKVLTFPYLDIYISTDNIPLVEYWEETKPVFEGTLEKAGDAYLKAYSLDKSPATTEKVQAGLEKVMNKFKQFAGNDHTKRNLKGALSNSIQAYEFSKKDIKSGLDSISGYNAGVLSTVTQNYADGEKYLREMLDIGYFVNGDVSFYLYAALFGQNKMQEAKDVLLESIKKYPNNTQIVEGLLNVYASTGDDPNEIIPYVQKAIEADPENPELYAGMGRVYDKLGHTDKSIESFQKANSLLPDDFSTNFNLGFMMLKKADNMAAELDRNLTTSRAAYDAELIKVLDAFKQSLPYLEKAHAVDPKESTTVELLKNVYFRLRDESPEMMANYNKYKDLFDTMEQ